MDLPSRDDLTQSPTTWYDLLEVTGRANLTPSPTSELNFESQKEECSKDIEKLGAAEWNEFKTLISNSKLADCFQSISNTNETDQNSPPIWEQRDKSARKNDGSRISPADWIKMHYGNFNLDGTWSANGLTRSDFNRNRVLYNAYSKWIQRHPEDDLKLATQKRDSSGTAEEILARRRKESRATYHRNK